MYKIAHGRTQFKFYTGALVRLGQQRIHWRRISTVLTGGPHQKAPSLHSIMLACAISNFQSLHFRGNLDTRSECNFHNPNACAQAQWIFITSFFLLFYRSKLTFLEVVNFFSGQRFGYYIICLIKGYKVNPKS